jgi:Flp pilus assembly protein TadG
MFVRSRNGGRRGQTLVLFALGLVALLGMVGLVIDGGNAFAQQRKTQNGADAAAEAGTTELARRAIGVPGTDAQWDARVNQAITDSATYNGLTVTGTPQYTDFDGNPLGPVNTGSIPANTYGVAVRGDRTFKTYVAGVMGITQLTSTAEATARTGYSTTFNASGLMPVTFPVMLEQCVPGSGSSALVLPTDSSGSHSWPVGPNNMVALPFCSNGPGNIGWIDWTPPAGGASELAAEILNPNGPAVHVNHWYFITQTGAVTSVDNEFDTWEGRDIYLPIFYVEAGTGSPPEPSLLGTCDTEPTDLTDVNSCPAGHQGGTGTNEWYYLTAFANFHLVHSYISNNHQAECNDPNLVSTATYDAAGTSGGSLLNNCLIGYFNEDVLVGGGEVSINPPSSSFQSWGVQLIK